MRRVHRESHLFCSGKPVRSLGLVPADENLHTISVHTRSHRYRAWTDGRLRCIHAVKRECRCLAAAVRAKLPRHRDGLRSKTPADRQTLAVLEVNDLPNQRRSQRTL